MELPNPTIASATTSGLIAGLSAKKQRKFSAREAGKSRAWSENMAKTKYQYTMADMKAAGLNPILAYSQGGGGTPSGATAQGVQADTSKVVSSGLDAYQKGLETIRLKDTLATTAATRDLLASQSLKARSDSLMAQTSAKEAVARTQLLLYKQPRAELGHDFWALKDYVPNLIETHIKKQGIKHKPAGRSGSSGSRSGQHGIPYKSHTWRH